MNLALLDLQARNALPEHIEYELREEGLARCAAFNRRASYLAVGCSDGRTVIWDFNTRGIAKILVGHVQPITSVCWSRNSRKLMTTSVDWNVIIWDVVAGSQDFVLKFDAPIAQGQLHPRGKNLLLVCPLLSDPVLVNLDTLERKIVPPLIISQDENEGQSEGEAKTTLKQQNSTTSETEVAASKANPDTNNSNQPNSTTPGSQITTAVVNQFLKKGNNSHSPVAIFSPTGDEIYSGDSRGYVSITDTETLAIKSYFRPATNMNASVKGLVISKDQRYLLINCSDKVVRVWNLKKNEIHKELLDAVNKHQWKAICFSSDQEHVLAGSAQRHEHKIYIWERQGGRLLKFLEGPKEGVMDLMWHPTQPILVSVSSHGTVYVWGAHHDETWSSFAPGFTELEENEEYIEREDEFDIIDNEDDDETIISDGSAIKKPKLMEEESDELVDITTIEKLEDCSSDEEDIVDELISLPANVIADKYLDPRSPQVAILLGATGMKAENKGKKKR